LRDFKIPPPIENPADCEVCAVIRFLSTKGFKAADIMDDEMVRKWARAFKDSQTFMMRNDMGDLQSLPMT